MQIADRGGYSPGRVTPSVGLFRETIICWLHNSAGMCGRAGVGLQSCVVRSSTSALVWPHLDLLRNLSLPIVALGWLLGGLCNLSQCG